MNAKNARENFHNKLTGDLQGGLERAKRRGLVVVEPKPNQLQIDIDSARALRRYGLQFAILRRAGLTKGWRERITPSKKRGHVHVTITMPIKTRVQINDDGCEYDHPIEMTLCQRICLQAILGSDLTREAFNYCRAVKGGKYPVVFFERGGK